MTKRGRRAYLRGISAPLVLFVLLAEAAILPPLWLAVARPGLSHATRFLLACLGLAAAWGLLVLVVVLHGPEWMMVTSVGVFALSSVVMAIAIHLCTCEEEDRPWGGGDSGGARCVGPDAPRGGGNAEPPWWPEFERQLASYMAEREAPTPQYSPSPRA